MNRKEFKESTGEDNILEEGIKCIIAVSKGNAFRYRHTEGYDMKRSIKWTARPE